MKHRAPQFDLAGQEQAFNLAGEIIREEPPTQKAPPKLDTFQLDIFTDSKQPSKETK